MGYIREAERVIRVAVEGTRNGRQIVTVLHYQSLVNGLSTGMVNAQINRLRDAWQLSAMDSLPANYTFTGGNVLSLDPDYIESFAFFPNTANPVVGAIGTPYSPPNVAWLVNKVTSTGPRGFRGGRIFMPGTSDDYVQNDGTLTAAIITVNQTAVDAFYNATVGTFSGEDWALVIPSWQGLLSPPPEAPTVVTADAIIPVDELQVQALVATQRRRLRG